MQREHTRPQLDFSIKTEVFEGPLELLIELVERRKLLINDISLATVTDEYLKKVSEMQERSLPHTALFITLAATLLLIKSKSLLPVLELSGEEEAIIEDLEERLKRYQIFRDVAKDLVTIFGKTTLYEPEFTPPREPIFHPTRECALSELTTAIGEVLTNLPKPEIKHTAHVRPTITLEEMISRVQSHIEQKIRTSFAAITQGEVERKTLIVGFLAILELFKQGGVIVTQSGRFADIEIEREHSDTPKYY
ncbi:segregation/condensation protein A [Patescibacteria group bacterium]|nr:segregation/condensation protein A [Patescibacteria group bacterium]